MIELIQARLLKIDRSLSDVSICLSSFESDRHETPKDFYSEGTRARLVAIKQELDKLQHRVGQLVIL